VYDHAQVRKVLPHRHPILLVDRVDELSYFDRAVAIKAVTGAEPCYSELAEDAPRTAFGYPRTLMLESFCQSGAFLWLTSARETGQQIFGSLIFAVAREVSFHHSAYPGDTLRNVVEIERIVADTAFFRGQIWIGDQRAAEVRSVVAAVRPELGDPGRSAALASRRASGNAGPER
jgi:3-hydroxyacyl-[acyl-carrier-protein] dehydratase